MAKDNLDIEMARSALKVEGGKYLTVLWSDDTPKLHIQDLQSGQEPSMCTVRRYAGINKDDKQVAFHFEDKEYNFYSPKVERDGNDFKLRMERYPERQSVLQDDGHWFKFVNVGSSEHWMLQSVVSSECYISIENSILVLKTKDDGVRVTEDVPLITLSPPGHS